MYAAAVNLATLCTTICKGGRSRRIYNTNGEKDIASVIVIPSNCNGLTVETTLKIYKCKFYTKSLFLLVININNNINYWLLLG